MSAGRPWQLSSSNDIDSCHLEGFDSYLEDLDSFYLEDIDNCHLDDRDRRHLEDIDNYKIDYLDLARM